MPHIKPDHLEPQHGTGYHGSFIGTAVGAIAANDIVQAMGYSGDKISFRTADADTAGRHLGMLGVADHAAATGEPIRVVSHKLVTGVDTNSATAIGYPVYLSDTAGGWGVSAGSAAMVIGNVVAKDSSAGAVLLAPAHSVGIE
ncbi:hypothetical protein CMI37_32265 [Candidatus Pacearchaeota archaeon]|nr:hypothetical protein [Candidatus Pacearchaeota archaeon]|tara:strand:- start:1393 stop:1821 length:429 start_codon:yes stop_codon:yes gene_type:complete